MPRLPFSVRYYRFIFGIGQVLAFVTAAGLAPIYFYDTKLDTLTWSLSIFAVLITSANVTFSFARTIEDDADLKDRLHFCGERLLQGALLLLSKLS